MDLHDSASRGNGRIAGCTDHWARLRHSFLGRLAPLGRAKCTQRLTDAVPRVFGAATEQVADRGLAAVAVRRDLALAHAVHVCQLRDES